MSNSKKIKKPINNYSKNAKSLPFKNLHNLDKIMQQKVHGLVAANSYQPLKKSINLAMEKHRNQAIELST